MILDQLIFGSARLTGGATAMSARRLVRACRDAGITRFDTAPSYGVGTAEDVIGRAVGRDDSVRIATKVGSYRPSYPHARTWARLVKRRIRPGASPLSVPLSPTIRDEPCHFAFALDQMARSVAQSQRALNRGTLDLLLLHDITPAQVNAQVVEFMLQARATGLARAVGHATGGLADPELEALFPSDFIVQAAASPAHLRGMVTSGGPTILHSIARTAEYLAREDATFADRLRTVAARVPPDRADATSARLAAAYALVHAHRPDCRLIFATTQLDRLQGFLEATRCLSESPAGSVGT